MREKIAKPTRKEQTEPGRMLRPQQQLTASWLCKLLRSMRRFLTSRTAAMELLPPPPPLAGRELAGTEEPQHLAPLLLEPNPGVVLSDSQKQRCHELAIASRCDLCETIQFMFSAQVTVSNRLPGIEPLGPLLAR